LTNLTNLTTLRLRNNRITQLPDWLDNLTNLTNLWLDNNQITHISSRLSEVATLSLNVNLLTELPGWIGDLAQLTSLRVGQNQLTYAPDWLSKLTDLVDLDLSGSHLAEVPSWLTSLTKLTNLHLDYNQFTHLPDSIGNLTNLTNLQLSNNQLTHLPDSIGNLTNLTNLQLSNNQLTHLPDSIGNLTKMRHIWLGYNKLSRLPDAIRNFADLSLLWLDEGQISDLPDWLGELTNLTTLWLANNQISQIPDSLSNLSALGYIDLSGNKITTLPDWLGELTNLTTLWLANNQISQIPDSLSNLHNLSDLNIEQNQLSHLPISMAKMASLQNLAVAENPLISPPPEIAAGGSDSILAFLAARERGSSAQWVSKLLVVGEGGVGKTSLVKALTNKDHDAGEPTTHGITVSNLKLPHPNTPDAQMQLNLWDFGGQQIYHATHQFFMSNRALFLLLWNSRLGWEQGKLQYWLDMITARAPESPIILVATHIHGRPVDLPLQELRDNHPMIRGSFSIDNETREGLEGLSKFISREAALLPLMGAEWPSDWLTATNAIRSTKEPYTTPQQLWQMLNDSGVADTPQQKYIATALHQLGDILYYHDDVELSQTVILKPSWVNEYISKVLDSSVVAGAHGILTRGHLDELWSDLNRGLRDHFLGMMDKFDLSYRIEGGRKGEISLVVERLQWDPPDFKTQWDTGYSTDNVHEIRVLYRLNTSPPGIPTWFIARSHRFSTGIHWRTGALLRSSDGKNLALVRADRHRNVVELSVRGPSPAAFFSVLDDGLNLTLERYPGLEILRQVPCPCGSENNDSGCAELFDYDDLQARLERNPPRDDIECRKSGTFVSVTRLLHGIAPTDRDATRANIEKLMRTMTSIVETVDKVDQNVNRVHDKIDYYGGYAQHMFLRLQHLAQLQQETRCPSVIAIVPLDGKRIASTPYEVRLYCEEPGAWHRLPESNGCYGIKQPNEWFQKLGPYLQFMITAFKHAAPLAGPILGIAVDQLDSQLKADCDLMKELANQVPAELAYKGELSSDQAQSDAASARATNDADFRALEAMLVKLDPERRWGGLSRFTTPEGLTLYLCDEHLASYKSPRQI
ncbi:COR domain-containing protein, partial [Actinosynnema sp. NPDC091369]